MTCGVRTHNLVDVRMKPTDHEITLADHFRTLAANYHGKASNETDPVHKAECERLAHCYLQLADESKSSLQQFVDLRQR